MGLDWCVRDKVIDGQEHNKAFADTHCQRINKQLDSAYAEFLEARGEEPPMIFPNDASAAFRETEEYKILQKDLDAWQETRLACVVTPMETLGCPRIGYDEEANKWAVNYYNEIKEDESLDKDRKASFLSDNPTVDNYLENNHGTFVPSLAKNKDGLGEVSGIAVGPESFRGKVIAYVDWLSDGLKSRAYEDHEPEELVSYGEHLLEEANSFDEQLNKEVQETESYSSTPRYKEAKEEVALVQSAGKWCVFWGENGHGMHAWY